MTRQPHNQAERKKTNRSTKPDALYTNAHSWPLPGTSLSGTPMSDFAGFGRKTSVALQSRLGKRPRVSQQSTGTLGCGAGNSGEGGPGSPSKATTHHFAHTERKAPLSSFTTMAPLRMVVQSKASPLLTKQPSPRCKSNRYSDQGCDLDKSLHFSVPGSLAE